MINSYLKIFKIAGEAKNDANDMTLELEVNNLTNMEAAKLLAMLVVSGASQLDKAYGLEKDHMLKSVFIILNKTIGKNLPKFVPEEENN